MPIYEYQCQSCRSDFSFLRPMEQADAPAECERCGGRRTKRKLSLFTAQSGGKSVAGTVGGSCAGCAGGSCGMCGQG